jgi:hypothetical protein
MGEISEGVPDTLARQKNTKKTMAGRNWYQSHRQEKLSGLHHFSVFLVHFNVIPTGVVSKIAQGKQLLWIYKVNSVGAPTVKLLCMRPRYYAKNVVIAPRCNVLPVVWLFPNLLGWGKMF